MKKLFLTLILSAIKLCYANEPLIIEKQGNFSVGGKIMQRDGKYDNSKFVGWAEQNEVGQSYEADHAFVNYQIPVNANKYPLVFIHGYGGSGVCWEMTPDGRDLNMPLLNELFTCQYIGLHQSIILQGPACTTSVYLLDVPNQPCQQ